jgi:hypothetical protein
VCSWPGVALLASGHISGSLPAVLIPFALTAFIVGSNVAGLRSLDRDIPKLIQEMNGILGSAVTFPQPGCCSGCRRHGGITLAPAVKFLRTFPRVSVVPSRRPRAGDSPFASSWVIGLAPAGRAPRRSACFGAVVGKQPQPHR